MNIEKLFTFELVDSKVKITYNDSKPFNAIIGIQLRGLEVLVDSVHHTFNQQGTWFIPYFDYTGCKYLSIFDNDNKVTKIDWLLPPEVTIKMKKQNLVCVGLNKTGTTSFQHDTETKLGYKYSNIFDGMSKVMSDLYHNDTSTLRSYLENPRYNAYKDIPFSLPKIYEKIYEIRPEDIYVLTVRSNVDVWLQSTMKYFGWLMKGELGNSERILEVFRGPYSNRYSNFFSPIVKSWGLTSYKNLEGQLKDMYEKHNEECINFFQRKHNTNFIVLDVSKQGEFKKFTNWMRVTNEIENFTQKNESK